MKQFLLLLTFSFSAIICLAQSNKQVKWTFTTKKIADKVYEIKMSANINGDFHLYSQNAGVDGPLPTTFVFVKNPLLVIDGKVKEMGKLVKKYESAWEGNVNYYEKTVDFVQTVKLRGNAKTNLSGKVEFMVCNDEKCLPPSEVEFSVNIGG